MVIGIRVDDVLYYAYVERSIGYVETKGEAIGVARTAHGPSGLDATVLQWEGLWVTLVTALREGQREVIALEVGPALEEADVAKRLSRRLRELASLLPQDSPPVSATALRSLPLRALMAARADLVEVPEALPDESSHRLAFLVDALTYVQATERGVSPATAIAEARGISVRTAEGRIRRARVLGLLTDVNSPRERSLLTEEAQRQIAAAKELPRRIREQWSKAAQKRHKEERK